MKKALITGITGQDGSYLAEFLLTKGYEVYGVIKEEDENNNTPWRIKNLLDSITLYSGDVKNLVFLKETFQAAMPDELYHLASRVDARVIYEEEQDVFETNFSSTYHLLRIVKEVKPNCRIFLAGSSLMFGEVDSSTQDEGTPMRPNTPYGIAKTAAFYFAKMYREVYGLFACTGILYNHESPRRDFHFLPRKITSFAAKIKLGLEKELVLGNIEAERDWGFAGDYIEAMWLMLQSNSARDYVIGTGKLHSVKEILDIAFGYVGLEWEKFVKLDEQFMRKVDPYNLCADSSKIKKDLGWVPKVGFKELIEVMVENDLTLSGKVKNQ